ncbi:MAG: hypothetical protein KGL39_50275 [Patescibacteria group bacterium]|nr:hypothetical protein [Patescibacteria group bacterium]
MGMDVYGRRPTSETGKYFRNNVWWWRPLAEYVVQTAPALAAKCRHWQSNDGDGLDAADSIALADALQAELDSGRCEAYAKIRAAEIEALPNKRCGLCEGTGIRKPIPEVGAGDLKRGGLTCNSCGGSGSVKDDATHYPFEVDNVREFVAFLRDCGGFEIC